MQLALNIVFIGLLFSIVYQDFKERKVSAYLFFILIILGGYMHFTKQYITSYLFNLIVNTSLILLLTIVLAIYSSFVLKVKLQEAIGLGDILFFFILAVSFPTATFLVILSSSLIFSFLLFTFLKSSLKNKTVPLAGLQALFLGAFIGSNLLFNFINLYTV